MQGLFHRSDIAAAPLGVALVALAWLPQNGSTDALGTSLGVLVGGCVLSLLLAPSRPMSASAWVGIGVLALLAGWYLLTRAWALDPGGSMLEAARFAAFGLTALTAHVVCARRTTQWLLVGCVALVALIVAAPLTIDVLLQGVPSYRDPGRTGYWNASGMVALLVAPLAVACLSARRLELTLAGAVLVSMAAGSLVATSSRGALLAIAIGMVLAALATRSPTRTILRVAVVLAAVVTVTWALGAGLPRTVLPVACLVLAAVVLVAGAWVVDRVGSGVESGIDRLGPGRTRIAGLAVALLCLGAAVIAYAPTDEPVDVQPTDVSRLTSTDDSLRWSWWGEAVELWRDHPLVGAGGGAFDVAHVDVSADTARHAHSLALQVATDTGVVGLVLALAAAAAWTIAIRRRRAVDGVVDPRALATGVAAAVMAQALLDWTLQLPLLLALAAAALGTASAGASVTGIGSRAGGRAAWRAVATVGATTLVLVALVPLASELAFDRAVHAFDDGAERRAADRAELALRLVPDDELVMFAVAAHDAADDRGAANRLLARYEKVVFASPSALRFALGRTDDPDAARRLRAQLDRRREREQARQDA